MTRFFPGRGSLVGGRLGLWETQAENGATERLSRQAKASAPQEEPQGVSEAFVRAAPHPARAIHWDQK